MPSALRLKFLGAQIALAHINPGYGWVDTVWGEGEGRHRSHKGARGVGGGGGGALSDPVSVGFG